MASEIRLSIPIYRLLYVFMRRTSGLNGSRDLAGDALQCACAPGAQVWSGTVGLFWR